MVEDGGLPLLETAFRHDQIVNTAMRARRAERDGDETEQGCDANETG
jgi:hypothetical protein